MNAPVSFNDGALMDIAAIRTGERIRRDLGDLEGLAASIAEIGLLHPVVVRPDGLLIAGERRLEAFKKLGRTLIPVTVLDLEMVVHGEYAENFFRKAFAPSELADIADALEPELRAQAKERQRESEGRGKKGQGISPTLTGQALDHLAKIIGKDRKTIVKARAVRDAAKKDPKLAPLMEEMDRTGRVDGAFKKLKAAVRADEITAKAKAVPSSGKRYRLVCGPVGRLMREPAGTIDLIVTDPPYPEEYLPLYGELARGASHVLKPGGLLICMTGQSWLPRVFAEIASGAAGDLEYLWTLAYLTPGGQATQVFPRKVNTFWKPVLVYSQGPYTGEWYGDVTRSDVNDNDKDHHHWGQSLSGMRDLMKRFVTPGQTVVDPFLGGGTTALIALELGATFLGFDIDKNAIETTKARLADVR